MLIINNNRNGWKESAIIVEDNIYEVIPEGLVVLPFNKVLKINNNNYIIINNNQ